MKFKNHLVCLVVVSVFLLTCRKTIDPTIRATPETQIFLDSIKVDSANRLSTNIEMHWFGNTPHGFIKGYEVSIDDGLWVFTKSTDSSFRFTITDTTGKQNIKLQVRAIDDQGVKDPTPAVLIIPIKNTLPEVKFQLGLTDSVFSVFTLRWTANDADGEETLDSVFFRINQGEWYGLSIKTTMVTFVPITPGTAGDSRATVYTETSAKLQSKNINGLKIDGINKVYIRVKDNSRAFSKLDSTISFFVARKKGDLLVVGSHLGGPVLRSCTFVSATCQPDARKPSEVLLAAIDTAYGVGSYDYVDIVTNSRKYTPKIWDPTFLLLMKLYDKVFWFGDITPDNNTCSLPLEVAAPSIQKYLNSGGKLLVSTSIPLTNYSSPVSCTSSDYRFNLSSPLFQYSPMDSMYLFTGCVLRRDSALKPTQNASGYPALVVLPSTGNIYTGLSPFKAKSGAEVMYTANISRTGAWIGVTGYSNFIARTRVGGKTNQVFSSIELNRMMGKPHNLTLFLQKVLTEEFNW